MDWVYRVEISISPAIGGRGNARFVRPVCRIGAGEL